MARMTSATRYGRRSNGWPGFFEGAGCSGTTGDCWFVGGRVAGGVGGGSGWTGWPLPITISQTVVAAAMANTPKTVSLVIRSSRADMPGRSSCRTRYLTASMLPPTAVPSASSSQ